MAKKANPPVCKCGCGEPTGRAYDSTGVFKNYLRYKRGHREQWTKGGLRRCTICKEWKPVELYKNHRSYCPTCFRERQKKARNAQWGSARAYWLWRRYKLTEDMFEAMKRPDGLCPLCEKRPAVVVDHCHETNINRGILCQKCNQALGHFGDNRAGVERLLKYFTAPDG